MFDNPERFQDLMTRLRGGSDDAARELVSKFAPHIYHAVKRRYRHRRLKALYQTEDWIQSVWGAVFGHLDRLSDCDNPRKLVNFLAQVATNKIIDRHRVLFAQKRGVGLECELTPSAVMNNEALLVKELTASQRAVIREEIAIRTREMSSEKRTILNMHTEGYTSVEISKKLEGRMSERGVRRMIQSIVDCFRKPHACDETGRNGRLMELK